MKNSLAEYRKDDGYEDEDGCFCEDAAALLQSGLLKFCMCGMPENNLLYVMRGLELIEERRSSSPDYHSDRAACDEWWKAHDARETAHFGTKEAAYFFWYWCDQQGLTEHGGSVPGWLDDKGIQLLGLLREWNSSEQAKEN